jgi:hypothetical protein
VLFLRTGQLCPILSFSQLNSTKVPTESMVASRAHAPSCRVRKTIRRDTGRQDERPHFKQTSSYAYALLWINGNNPRPPSFRQGAPLPQGLAYVVVRMLHLQSLPVESEVAAVIRTAIGLADPRSFLKAPACPAIPGFWDSGVVT